MGAQMKKLLAMLLVLTLMSPSLAAVAEAVLELPASLKIIDEEAFYQATAIDEAVVPEGTTEIRSKAFAYSSLEQITLPESVEYIADDAFEGCENLTLLTPRDSYAHQWAAFSGQDYDIIGDADDSPAECSVWGVDVTVGTDADGAETVCLGAYVTAAVDCTLTLSVYTDELSLLGSCSAEVPAGTAEEYIQAEYAQTLPEYYALEAVLTGDGVEESCWEYCYTEAYAAFEAQSPSDFPESRVLDFGSNGYAVLADGVLVLNASATQSDDSYTFATDQALQPGDCILLEVDGEPVALKIATVRDNGDGTVTVTEDSDVYLCDLYDAINVEGYLSGAASTLSVYDEPADHVLSFENTFSYKEVLELSYEFETSIHLSFKYDKSIIKDGDLRVIFDTTASFEGFLGGEIDTFKDGITPAIQIYSGILPRKFSSPVFMYIDVPFNIKAEAGGDFHLTTQNSYGFRWANQKFYAIQEEGPRDADVRLKGDFEFTFGPQIALTTALFHALRVRVGAQFGVKATGSAYIPDSNTDAEEARHACNLCVDMDLYAIANARANLSYKIWKECTGSLLDANIAVYEKGLGEAYFSLLNDAESIFGGQPTVGWDQDCPNYKYRARVYTNDSAGETVEGLPVTVTGQSTAAGQDSPVEIEPVAGESRLQTYLYPGSYTATAEFDSGEAAKAFEVESSAVNVTVQEAVLTISGHVTDSATGEAIPGAAVELTLSDGTAYSAAADEEGFYSFGELYGTSFKVTASDDEYYTVTKSVTIPEGTTEGTVDFALDPLQYVETVSGHVTDSETGEPISGATVSLNSDTGTYTATTDDEGYYCIDGLKTRSLSFTVSATDYNRAISKSIYNKPDPELTFDFELTPKIKLTKVSGHVTDKETGEAISGATVKMTLNGTAYSTATDEEGYYCFDGLSETSINRSIIVTADRYMSMAAMANSTAATSSEEVVDFQMPPLKANISGAVIDAETGEVISGATVEVTQADGTAYSTTTDDEGMYAFESLSGSSFAFVVSADGYETGEDTLEISGTATDFTKNFELYSELGTPAVTPFAASKATVDGDSVIFSMGYTGLTYTSGKGEIAYNFKGEYDSMSFTAGYYSGDERDATMTVTADGNVLYDSVTISCEAPQSFTIPLTGVEQLVICFVSDVYDTTSYAISRIRLTPAGEVSGGILTSDDDFTACFSSSKYGYSTTDTFSMGGYTYQGGYMLYMGYVASGDNSWITFDFGGEYSKLSFDIAKYMNRYPESYLRSAYLTITADGVVVGEYDAKELKWNDVSLPVEVDLSGVSELTIKLNSAGYDRVYWAVGNFHLE